MCVGVETWKHYPRPAISSCTTREITEYGSTESQNILTKPPATNGTRYYGTAYKIVPTSKSFYINRFGSDTFRTSQA